jgi:hypothetical protein
MGRPSAFVELGKTWEEKLKMYFRIEVSSITCFWDCHLPLVCSSC